MNISNNKNIMCKLDADGKIDYGSSYFIDLFAYKGWEIIGEKFEALYADTMPKAISATIWKNILDKKRSNTIIQFASKTGTIFWLHVKLDFRINEKTRAIRSIYMYGTPVRKQVVPAIEKMYTILHNMEMKEGVLASKKYFDNYLAKNKLDFNTYFNNFLVV